VIWIWIAITVPLAVFRGHDIGTWGKAAWTMFIIVPEERQQEPSKSPG
jgi:hypothetical protein